MLKRLDLRAVDGDLRAHLPRPRAALEPPVEAVRAVLEAVRTRGDAAVRELTERFDGVTVEDHRVEPADVEAALTEIPPLLREALEAARGNILAYHRALLPSDHDHEREGIRVREVHTAVERAGVYVPGGAAPLLSTVLMTAIPARVAGVDEVVLCTPPAADGRVPAEILAAAALAGVDEVHAIGGAQAIAAMAYGTESMQPVDVIVGPGNVYVSVAKREVAGIVGVPSSFAGPSEVVVVADASTPPEAAAIDLIVQVEHGPDSVAWLITWDEAVADEIVSCVARLAAANPRRDVIESNLAANSYTAIVSDAAQAVAVANAIAPEHLELMTEEPEELVRLVRHAGAVFTGVHAPASVGDYIAGPSHVLPTYGSARYAGALTPSDFLKSVHVVSLDAAALARVAPHVAALAEAEGLAAHAESVRIRSAP